MHSADDADFMKKWPWIKIRGLVLRIHLSYCSYDELHQWYIGGVHTRWSQYIDWIEISGVEPCSQDTPQLLFIYITQPPP